MKPTEILRDAVKSLGGQVAAGRLVGRSQPVIARYLAGGRPQLDVVMRIELATRGRYRAEHMRPDLGDLLRAFRRLPR